MSEPVPRRGSARRALLRGGLVLLMLALIAGAVAAALDRDLIDDDGFFGGNDEIATRTPAPVANVAAATPIATPRQVAAARPTATRSPATVTPRPSPTVAPADAEATETVPSRRPTSTPAGARGGVVDLEAMLPTSDEVPGQLPEETTAERNADDVALSFGDDAEAAAARLEEWGWSQNLYRNFVGDEATADPASVTTINVSLHRFDSDTSAAAALTYFSDTAAAGGLTDAEIEPIGENSRALIGGETGSNLAAVYVQKGPVLIRVGTFSPAGEALPAAIEVAQTVAAK